MANEKDKTSQIWALLGNPCNGGGYSILGITVMGLPISGNAHIAEYSSHRISRRNVVHTWCPMGFLYRHCGAEVSIYDTRTWTLGFERCR